MVSSKAIGLHITREASTVADLLLLLFKANNTIASYVGLSGPYVRAPYPPSPPPSPPANSPPAVPSSVNSPPVNYDSIGTVLSCPNPGQWTFDILQGEGTTLEWALNQLIESINGISTQTGVNLVADGM